MSLQAAADSVAKGDPDRHLAAMAAPVAARRVLFPLYAFNVEVARAPWVTSEPMIGEMRLQWWRDALEEIASDGPVRKHEVTTPLAEILDAKGAHHLDTSVAARRWDLYTDPFEDEAHLLGYLNQTGGHLMWVAARALGAPETAEHAVEAFGRATALARFLKAVPELEARGRIPLLDSTPEGVTALTRKVVADMPSPRALRATLPKLARASLLEGWQTRTLLAQVLKSPDRVANGTLGFSEFRTRLTLLRASIF